MRRDGRKIVSFSGEIIDLRHVSASEREREWEVEGIKEREKNKNILLGNQHDSDDDGNE